MKTYQRLPFGLKCVGFNSSSLLLLKKGDDIHINKQTAWLDTSTVSSCGGMDLDDAPSVCCLSPTVPDFSCSTRMPWHLPDTIVPSCLEGWRQCGMIWKEFGCWRCTRRKMQWAGTQLFHIYSGVCQKKKKKKQVPDAVLCKLWQSTDKKDGILCNFPCLLLTVYARQQPKSENTSLAR